MAIYRVHAGGVWSTGHSLYRRLGEVESVVEVHEMLNRHTDRRFEAEVRREVANLYERAALGFYRDSRHRWARLCAWRCLRRRPALQWLLRWRPTAVLALSALHVPNATAQRLRRVGAAAR